MKDIVPDSMLKAGQACLGQAAIRLADYLYAVTKSCELAVYQRIQLVHRGIRAAVINKDKLDVAIALAKHRSRALLDVALHFIDGNYDAYFHFS